MIHCEDCGATFGRALKLQAGKTTRIVCPECKSAGIRLEVPNPLGPGVKYKVTIKKVEDDE